MDNYSVTREILGDGTYKYNLVTIVDDFHLYHEILSKNELSDEDLNNYNSNYASAFERNIKYRTLSKSIRSFITLDTLENDLEVLEPESEEN